MRLPHYDYAQAGAYFVTIVCRDRACVLGTVARARMALSPLGRIVRDGWLQSIAMRDELAIDAFVVMPNHFHGIVSISDAGACTNDVEAHGRAPLHRPPRSLGSFVAAFKAATTKHINAHRQTPSAPFWLRNYYEHIIRDEGDLSRIRRYIHDNPLRWELDRESPNSRGARPCTSTRDRAKPSP